MENDDREVKYLLNSHREWIPFADVTLDDTALYGMLPPPITITNNAIEKMIENWY